MGRNASFPPLDLKAVDFPSNHVTIGQIRKEQPEQFVSYDEMCDDHIGALNIAATIASEVELAQNAYAKALGQVEPYLKVHRRHAISVLNDDYRRYSISSGMQQTEQLVRDFEAAASAQARRHIKRGR